MELIDIILIAVIGIALYMTYRPSTAKISQIDTKRLSSFGNKVGSSIKYYSKLMMNDFILLIVFIILWRGWELFMEFIYVNKNVSPDNLSVTPLYNFEDISVIIFGLYAAFLIVRFSIIFTQLMNRSIAVYIEYELEKDFNMLDKWKKILVVMCFVCLFGLLASLSMLAL